MSAPPEITCFRGVLPPESRAFNPPPSQASLGGLILNVLSPLRGQIDAALAQGEQLLALRLVYAALSRVADALAMHSLRHRETVQTVGPGQVRIHALLVQLAPLPLETLPDGTLKELGTQVEVSYRGWVVARAEADVWAAQLTEHFQSLWPGAWVMVDGR